MRSAIVFLSALLTASTIAAQQAPPPNQAALAAAREHAKAGRIAEAIAALERVTPPAACSRRRAVQS